MNIFLIPAIETPVEHRCVAILSSLKYTSTKWKQYCGKNKRVSLETLLFYIKNL